MIRILFVALATVFFPHSSFSQKKDSVFSRDSSRWRMTFYADGLPDSLIEYQYDFPSGKVTKYVDWPSPEPLVQCEGKNVLSKYQGPFISYYTNGKLLAKTEYDNGRFNGIQKVFLPERQDTPVAVLNYTMGEKRGESVFFSMDFSEQTKLIYRSGELEECRVYNSKGELMDESWFSSGKPRNARKIMLPGQKVILVSYQSGQIYELKVKSTDNKLQYFSCYYKSGKKEGTYWYNLFAPGAAKADTIITGTFRNGIAEGEVNIRDKNLKILFTRVFRNGIEIKDSARGTAPDGKPLLPGSSSFAVYSSMPVFPVSWEEMALDTEAVFSTSKKLYPDFSEAEILPQYPGGTTVLIDALTLALPEKLLNGNPRAVKIDITIGKDGKLTKVGLSAGAQISAALKNEIVKQLTALKNFIPGKIAGQDSEFTLPVMVKLTEK